MNAHARAIEAVGWWEITRDEMAQSYAAVIRYEPDADWTSLNRAIIDRWSPSALEYIKRKAWKINASLAAASRTATGEDAR